MSVKKVIEKTAKVLDKQRELNDLILELETEVNNLKESIEVKSKVAEPEIYNTKETVFKKEVIFKEKTIVKEKTIAKPPEFRPRKQYVFPEKSEEQKIKDAKREATRQSITEFFLGKNVIAKIAVVLIFLGIVTFGRMAYIRWLNDVGRFVLILGIGISSGGLGYFFEKRKSNVFNNVFYGVSVFILYLAFLLGKFEYELMSSTMYFVSSIGLTAIVFGYFYKRRYDFLDSLLMLFYYTVVLTQLTASFQLDISIFDMILITVLVLGVAGISYLYFTKYVREEGKQVSFTTSLITLGLFVFTISSILAGSGSTYIVMLYLGLNIFFIYLINLTHILKGNWVQSIIITLASIAILILTGIAIRFSLFEAGILLNGSYITLIIATIFVPMYILLFIRNKQEDSPYLNMYSLVITTILIIFALTAAHGNSSEGITALYSHYIRNIILLSEVLIFYGISKLTKYDMHKKLFYILIGVGGLFSLIYFTSIGDFTFNDIGMLMVNLAFVILIYGVNYLFYRYKQIDHTEDNMVLNLAGILLIAPLVATLSREGLRLDSSVALTSVVLFFIGYRWLLNLKFFKVKDLHKELIIFLNILILIFIVVINFKYFDHRFIYFGDVFKFVYVLGVNIYVVKALEELYDYYKTEDYEEVLFIFMFLIGVVIQSLFIHYYLNIEFDKVILSSYFMISSSVAILYGFKSGWTKVRKIGLAAIYFSLIKFFIYDFYTQEFSEYVKMGTYFILGFVLLGISFLYAYLERTYGFQNEDEI
jgi:hypothetical protein